MSDILGSTGPIKVKFGTAVQYHRENLHTKFPGLFDLTWNGPI